MNEDGTTKVKLRPVALLGIAKKLFVSIAVDQAADLVTLMQTQVGFIVTNGADAMIGAVHVASRRSRRKRERKHLGACIHFASSRNPFGLRLQPNGATRTSL